MLQNFKDRKVGDYEISLRPYVNKDSYSAFVANLKPEATPEEIIKVFSRYQPILSCSILHSKSQTSRNASITFGSK